MMHDFTLDLADENATLAMGARLATVIQPNLAIFLHGDLGAGKTTLVRGFLHGLGFSGKVKSPTYTLLESYEINLENSLKLAINHFDLYRFNDDEEWEAAGFREAFNHQSVCLIEWPEKAENCLPSPDVEIHLSVKILENQLSGRTIRVVGLSERGKQVVSHLA